MFYSKKLGRIGFLYFFIAFLIYIFLKIFIASKIPSVGIFELFSDFSFIFISWLISDCVMLFIMRDNSVSFSKNIVILDFLIGLVIFFLFFFLGFSIFNNVFIVLSALLMLRLFRDVKTLTTQSN